MTRMEIRSAGESMATKWAWFLLLGVVLIACGAAAVILPAASSIAASVVLGVALAIGGLTRIIEALQVKEWAGRTWQLLLGAVEVVGGILIYLNPLKGAFAITLLIAVVFLIQGLLQIALASRVYPRVGWGWLFVAGLIALCVTGAMVMKLRFTGFYTPGTIAGIALIVGGCAYVAIALTNRRAVRQETLA
jgi:uncharacterized membrane protein HdeD (DUF308 family)